MADDPKIIFKFEDDSSADITSEPSSKSQAGPVAPKSTIPVSSQQEQRSAKTAAIQTAKSIAEALSKGDIRSIPKLIKGGIESALDIAQNAPKTTKAVMRDKWAAEGMKRFVEASTPKGTATAIQQAQGVSVVKNATDAQKSAAPIGKAISELPQALELLPELTEAAGAGMAGAGASAATAGSALAAIAGPAAIVVSVLAAMGGLLYAVNSHLNEMIKELTPFSGALAASKARNQTAKTLQDIERAQKFGEQLAQKNDADERFDRNWTALKDGISAPFTEFFTEAKNTFSDILESVQGIDNSLSGMEKRMGKNPFTFMEELQKKFADVPLLENEAILAKLNKNKFGGKSKLSVGDEIGLGKIAGGMLP